MRPLRFECSSSSRRAKLSRMRVLDIPVDQTELQAAAARIVSWATARVRAGRLVCCADAHVLVRCRLDPNYRTIVERADLVTADGQPVAWLASWHSAKRQPRVDGPSLMTAVCAVAEDAGVPIGLYGGTPGMIARLTLNLKRAFPNLNVAYSHSPPFRNLTANERDDVREAIVRSGARILFVGLGCPKQERWIDSNRDLPLVMLGVGWAFAIHANTSRRAPRWMQTAGLETLHQIIIEPARISRYAWVVPTFLFLALGDVLTSRQRWSGKRDA
jgi:N-acetylglucosaminyldiphosphoundecaprenol N-acetyl-beta-D-mannosaminyltransferase